MNRVGESKNFFSKQFKKIWLKVYVGKPPNFRPEIGGWIIQTFKYKGSSQADLTRETYYTIYWARVFRSKAFIIIITALTTVLIQEIFNYVQSKDKRQDSPAGLKEDGQEKFNWSEEVWFYDARRSIY